MPFQKTKDTLPERQHNIPIVDLPQSFRDAVKITRRLGQRYLWIDALCIIQDSIEDWKAESIQMGDIYRRSTFAIAAAASKNSTTRIFHGGNC